MTRMESNCPAPRWLVAKSAVFAVAFSFGCGSSPDSSLFQGGSGGTGSGSGGGSSGVGGSGGSISGSGGGIIGQSDGSILTGGSTGSGGGDGGFQECVGVSKEAEGQKLDMYVILDHTGSMGADCPLNLQAPPSVNSKWCYATNALGRYFTSPQAAGHRAALQFLAVQGFTCNGGPTNAEATPVVPMTLLPVAANGQLITTLDTANATGGLGTPIEAGLRGITTFTAGNVTAGRTMIGILITDGDPNGCDGNVQNLATIPQQHLMATGIRTFIIGMTGATLTNLEPIATAGGAMPHTDFCGNGVASCHYWSVGNGDPAAFVSSLQAIAGQAVIPCQYAIPAPPAGQTLDPGLVNVSFTNAQGMDSQLFHVASQAMCDPVKGGWYYDNPNAPTSVSLCKATCDTVTAAGTGSNVHVSFGCATIVTPPVK
jgi:hypothetical protein